MAAFFFSLLLVEVMSHDQLGRTFQTAEVDRGWIRTFSSVTETACGCLSHSPTAARRRQFHVQGTGSSDAEQQIKKKLKMKQSVVITY